MVNYNLAAFQEPRGVMRVIQFIFSICAFATTTNFVSELTFSKLGSETETLEIKYPFFVAENKLGADVNVDPASDAQFFVATGVLSMMYCIFIIAVYLFIDDFYKSKAEIPMADFGLTTILAIFWLSGSAAWANGTSALKATTEPNTLAKKCACDVVQSSFSRLNVSLIFGFLNFFLWASDLWFLYKETIWFQGRAAGVGGNPSV